VRTVRESVGSLQSTRLQVSVTNRIRSGFPVELPFIRLPAALKDYSALRRRRLIFQPAGYLHRQTRISPASSVSYPPDDVGISDQARRTGIPVRIADRPVISRADHGIELPDETGKPATGCCRIAGSSLLPDMEVDHFARVRPGVVQAESGSSAEQLARSGGRFSGSPREVIGFQIPVLFSSAGVLEPG
jgi:hypothetical protein